MPLASLDQTVSRARAPDLSAPLNVKAIVLDMDGTLMPTYQWLRTIGRLGRKIGEIARQTDDFFEYLTYEYPFQGLLHEPSLFWRAAHRYTPSEKHQDLGTLHGHARGEQAASFVFYRGVATFLKLAKSQGAFVAIYTNTPATYALKRLHRAGLDPALVDAVWARDDRTASVDETPSPIVSPLIAKLISYEFRKPSPIPLLLISELSGCQPDEIAFIGDSQTDFQVVFPRHLDALGLFFLQEKGARDICDETCAVNNRLRKARDGLGIAPVSQQIAERGAGDMVFRLADGFEDVLAMTRRGDLRFTAPDRHPVVRDGQLSLAR